MTAFASYWEDWPKFPVAEAHKHAVILHIEFHAISLLSLQKWKDIVKWALFLLVFSLALQIYL